MAEYQNTPLNYALLEEVTANIADFGDFEGACECQQKKLSYYGRNERSNYLRALHRTLQTEPTSMKVQNISI